MRLLLRVHGLLLCCVMLLAHCSAARAELIGYWPMDEGSGETVADHSGNDLTGYLQGDTEWMEGMFGGGLLFNGNFDHVRVPDESDAIDEQSNDNIEKLRFTVDDSFTAMAWVFIPEQAGTGWQGVVTKGRDTSPTAWWGLWIDSASHWAYGHNGNHLRGGSLGLDPVEEGWTHFAIQQDADQGILTMYLNGEEVGLYEGVEPQESPGDLVFGGAGGITGCCDNEWFVGGLDEVRVYDEVLTIEQLQTIMAGPADGGPVLRAGDADQDLDFDQIDLVQVQIAAKYLTGNPATWGEGDWNGAPGGAPGSPPPGNGLFDQIDIISALTAGTYLAGPYAAIAPGGEIGDGQTSIVYNTTTGEVSVDAPAGTDLTSVNIDSAAGIFTGDAAQNLGGSFDNDSDSNIFKATFGSSFGTLSFGNVAQTGLAEDFVLNDLTVVGSLAGGGDLGNVDLVYVPEPSTIGLFVFGLLVGLRRLRREHV